MEGNVPGHLAFVDSAASAGAQLIVFSELSLTGYEPGLAADLARHPHDGCFAPLAASASELGVVLVVGVPTPGRLRPRISSLRFAPHEEASLYSKQYLHADEEEFFEPGPPADGIIYCDPKVALAICYELSVAEHARRAFQSGASTYVASVAKTRRGVEDASLRLSQVARQHQQLVLMANCLGKLDNVECTGLSAVWNRDGKQIAHLDAEQEGILIVDTNEPPKASQLVDF